MHEIAFTVNYYLHFCPSFIGYMYTHFFLSLSQGIQKKRASATSSKRPVNLSFSQSYSRQVKEITINYFIFVWSLSQVSGASSQGSRNSEIYLKDKEQAEKLSEALEKQSSIDGLEKIVLDQS